MDFCPMVEIMAESTHHHPEREVSSFLPAELENSQGRTLISPAQVRCPPLRSLTVTRMVMDGLTMPHSL